MITILIADDVLKAKEVLKEFLDNKGYILSDAINQEAAVQVAQKLDRKDLSTLGDKVIELEEMLMNEKRGILYKSILEVIEKPLIEHTLKITEGNQVKAARVLGINRNTMRAKIKKLGINPEQWKLT